MELTGDQLKEAESRVKSFLPGSLQVYGYLVLRDSGGSDPVKVFVDRWPDFHVIVCRPQCEEDGDLFKDTLVFADDGDALEDMIRRTSVFDWTRYLCVGTDLRNIDTFRAVASELDVPSVQLSVCHTMMLEDVKDLPSTHSSQVSLSSLDQSHVPLVNQTWKFGSKNATRMIRNMIVNFPSCCVLDDGGRPVSWILTYASGAMGMLFTLPEHRGKGFAKLVISTMSRRFHAQGKPAFCFIEEENAGSYRLFKNLGFTEVPSHRESWFEFGSL